MKGTHMGIYNTCNIFTVICNMKLMIYIHIKYLIRFPYMGKYSSKS